MQHLLQVLRKSLASGTPNGSGVLLWSLVGSLVLFAGCASTGGSQQGENRGWTRAGTETTTTTATSGSENETIWERARPQGDEQESDGPSATSGERNRTILETGPSRDMASGNMSEAISLRAQVYEAMGRVNRAQALGEFTAMERALDEAMEGIRALTKMPSVMSEPEVRELYRSVITAYEQYHGVSDTLMAAYGDIFAVRDAMFSTLNDVQEPMLSNTETPSAPVAMTIPLQTNRLVEQSVAYLQRNPERHISAWLRRAGTYSPMIDKILMEEGVPVELKYLAMIESGLNPKARSHAGAVGMWQFMAATGRAYGLRQNEWIDERQDPEKATRAAARHLRDLHEQFDDWYLALAAYNTGAGRVTRALRRVGSHPKGNATFWDVYSHLPKETRNYVPMYLATVMVATNPDQYDIPPVVRDAPYRYDVAEIDGMLSLEQAATLAGTDVAALRALNPELRKSTTPPTNSAYALRVPAGLGTVFATRYAALPPEERSGMLRYRVRRGDTLSKIARQHGTSVAALREVNGKRGSVIQLGEELLVPVPAGSGSVASTSGNATVRTVSYSDNSQSTRASTPVRVGDPAARTSSSSSTSGTRVRYQVRRGDTLIGIAQRYGVSVPDLQSWNNISGTRIQRGQYLTLYTDGSGSSRSSSTQGSTSSASLSTYTVRRGDSLGRIARNHGVSVSDLRQWNNLSSDVIRPGQKLKLKSEKQWFNHRVKRGESLTKIAQTYGVSIADIRKWNTLSTDRLRVGQRLAIYSN